MYFSVTFLVLELEQTNERFPKQSEPKLGGQPETVKSAGKNNTQFSSKHVSKKALQRRISKLLKCLKFTFSSSTVWK